MTKVYKIEKLNLPDSTYGEGTRQIEMKINEIVEVLNSLALDEKKEEPKEECPACRVEYYGVEAVHSKHNCGKEESKLEECERCKFDKLPGEYTLPFNYEIPHSCKKDKKEEPKSTLREKTFETISICDTETALGTERCADKIISLFKDTLLKEIDRLDSIDGGYGYDRREIEQIIQNL